VCGIPLGKVLNTVIRFRLGPERLQRYASSIGTSVLGTET
jgi:hypothetical protein